MKLVLALAAALVAAAAFGGADAADSATRKVAVCHKTSSKTRPYQRILVSSTQLRAHIRHADDIYPAPRTCPRTLLTPNAGGVPVEVTLLGVSEQPQPGDVDATGSATLRLRLGQGRVCYSLTARDITQPAAGAHIHVGTVEESGPIAVTLTPPGGGGTSSGCVAVGRPLVKEMLQNPSRFYVNVHTTDFPAGAIRGQLSMPSSAVVLTARMTGAAERPNPGDADGTGFSAFLLFPDAGRVCYTLSVANITLPTAAAHIHRAPATEAGPVVVPLQAPNAQGAASACINADAALLREIAANPANFYSNVHTRDFPGGAVRGQLARGTS